MAGLIFLLVVAIIVIGVLAYFLFQKRKQLKRYQGILDVEAEQSRIQKENQNLSSENQHDHLASELVEEKH